MSYAIETVNLTHYYSKGTVQQVAAINDINLQIEKGELVGIIGHTGSGKSTLISHFNGLLKPDSGKVIVDGEDKGNIVYSPNTLHIKGLADGRHKVDIKLFTNRFNSFGSVHLANEKLSWHGPNAWREGNEQWSYEYNLKKVGILTTPRIKK